MELLTLESEQIRVQVAPECGGRIVSFVSKRSGYEFLWRNARLPLERREPGDEYDPNFYGGIDELLPNDIPEYIDGVDCPDHGEMWTLPMSVQGQILRATLPRFGLYVERHITVSGYECRVKARIENRTEEPRNFLWKLHAALQIQPGDRIECSAARYLSADPDWSRRKGEGPWTGEIVPEFDGTTEFLYLYPLKRGRMRWRRGEKRFEVEFDPDVFRYPWYFASYGGFDGHHVAILEPCTSFLISVNGASQLGKCSRLEPGQAIETRYVYRGIDED